MSGAPMALVEDDTAIKLRPPKPLHDLLKAGGASSARADERAVREEENTILEVPGQPPRFGCRIQCCTVVYDRQLHA